MKRITGVNSNCYHGFGIEEALEGIAAAGFHYVELTATKGWTEHVFPDQTFEQLVRVKDRMKSLGLVPFAMSGHCNLMDRERLSDFIMNIRLAAFYGCDYIVSSVGEAHLKDKDTGPDERVAEHIRLLLPYLEEHAMTLVLESHGEHATGAVLKRITDWVASPRVGINYDTANVIFYGGVDPVADMDCCMGDIRYMHLKDKAGEQKEWNFPALGKGTVDFPGILDKLEKAGNDCPFSIEIEFTPEGPGSLEAVNRAVRDSAKYLRGLGIEL